MRQNRQSAVTSKSLKIVDILRAAIEPLELRTLLSTTIASGQTIGGNLAAAGQQDSYTFTANAGDSLELSFGHADSSSHFQSEITLLGPAHQQIDQESTASISDAAKIKYLVPTGGSGTYTAVVQDVGSGSSHTGTYDIEYVKVPATQTADSDGDSGALVNGATRGGTLDRKGDFDVYTFSTAVGDSYELSLAHADTTSTFQGDLTVYDPHGALVDREITASISDAVKVKERVAAGGAGTYTVVVQDVGSSSSQVGTYALEFAKIPGALAADSNGDGGGITAGQTKNGTLNRIGDFDVFTFSASVGDSYTFTLDPTSNIQGDLAIFGPDGHQVDRAVTAVLNEAVTISSTVPAGGAGTYTAIAQDLGGGGNQVGTYTAQLTGNLHPVTPPVQTGAISGVVFNDANDNGVKNTGEAGLANVTVTLHVSGTNTTTNAITNASGQYSFSNLAAGSYFVSEAVLSGYTQTTPSLQSNNGEYSVTLTSGQSITTEQFGQHKTPVTPPPAQGTGSITGTVFNDANHNGIRDAGEGPIVGVEVDLFTGVSEAETTTDKNGTFDFDFVKAGAHTLTDHLQSGFTQTVPAGGSYMLNTTDGQIITGELFGQTNTPVTPPPTGTGTLTGTLWNDTDGDGQFDHGEVGTGVRQVFIDTNGNGQLDAGERSTMSNASGVYTFSNVAASQIHVTRTFPAGFHLSNASSGTNGHDVVVTVTSGATATANLGTHEDGGVTPPPVINGAISGTLWNDTDGDGQFDHGEVGTGVRQVFIDTNGNGQLDAGEISTMSDGAGRYTFLNIAPGTYKISRIFPAGFHLSDASAGTNGHDVIVTVASGTTANVNLGTHEGAVLPPPPSTGSIAGTLWNDTDGDGQFDHGEVGTGVRQVFIDTNGNGQLDAGEISKMSNAKGLYNFDDLPVGSYKISRVFPAGFRLSNASAGTGGHDVIALVTGGNVTTANLGTHETNVINV